MQKRVFQLLVDNTSGVLSRISGLFSRRGYNIESITAGVTADPRFTRITIVTSGDEDILEQIEKQVGKLVDVRDIKELDPENNRISLGYKKTEDNPWEKFKATYKVGDIVDATIVSITPFGAFAQIMDGVDGLIHISQLADKRVENVKDIVAIGDVVKVKIIDIDIENKRISISMRALLEDEAEGEDAE